MNNFISYSFVSYYNIGVIYFYIYNMNSVKK